MPGRRKLSMRKICVLIALFCVLLVYYIYLLFSKNNNSFIPIIGSEDGFFFVLRSRSSIELSIMRDSFYEMNFLDLDNNIILEGLSAKGNKYYAVSKDTGKVERVDLEVDTDVGNTITAKRVEFVSYSQFLEIQEERLHYDLSLSNFNQVMTLQRFDIMPEIDNALNHVSYSQDELLDIPFRVDIQKVETDVYHIDVYLSGDGEPIVFIMSY